MTALNYHLIQKSIYEKITGNSEIMVLVNGVYDYVPQETAFPYITFVSVASNDLSNLSVNIYECRFSINIWSRQAGHKQASEIMSKLHALLHNGVLSIEGYGFIQMLAAGSSLQMSNDGLTYVGNIDLRVIVS